MPGSGGLRTTLTATAMVWPVKEDLNLNQPPKHLYWDAMIEQLRQTMLQQEVAFRNQVRELHRLYWNQKNLMKEAFRNQSSWAVACNRAQERELLMQEQQFNGFESQSQMENSRHCLSISMQLPLNCFHGSSGQHVTNQFLEVKRTACGQEMKVTISGQNADVSLKRPKVAFGNGQINWNQSYTYDNSRIDLEVPAELEHKMVAGRICSSGSRTLQADGVSASQSGDTVLSDFNSASRMQNDSCPMPLKYNDFPDHQIGNCSQKFFFCCDSEVQNSGSARSLNLPTEKYQASSNHFHIDLNIAQDQESVDASYDLVQTFSTLSTSSSGITNGDREKNLSSKCCGKAEPISVEKPSETALPVPGHHSSEKWLSVVEESECFKRQGSELCSSTVTKNGNFEKHVVGNGVYRSSTESPIEFDENSTNTISNPYNGSSHNSTSDASISIRGLTRPGVEKVGFPLACQQTIMNDVNTNASSCVTSKDGMEDNRAGASVGSTNLLRSTVRHSQEQQRHNELIKDDTISSRDVSCEQLKSVVENFPHCNKLKLLAGSGEFTSENKRVTESKFKSKVDASNHEIVNNDEVPYVYTDDHISSNGIHGEKVQKQTQSTEMDLMVVKAASTLLSISLENSAYSHPSLDTDILELEAGSKNDQPQNSLDSFERITLELEELKDDGSSISSKHHEKERVIQFCSVNLRRGRRLRDFQKDILPGLVSLSRHEICEDIHTIKYELRKNRSRRACGQNFLVPIRSKRSRLQKYL